MAKTRAAGAKRNPYGLTDKEILFVDTYFATGDSGIAIREAGYSTSSDEVTKVKASQLLAKQAVRDYLNEKRGAILDKLDLKAERLIQELKDIAFFNIKDVVNGEFTLEDFINLPREATAAVAGFKVDKNKGTVDVKFHDKTRAMDMIGKHFGIFELHNQQKNFADLDTSKLSDKQLNAFLQLVRLMKTKPTTEE